MSREQPASDFPGRDEPGDTARAGCPAPASADYIRLMLSVIGPPLLLLFGMGINYAITDPVCRLGWSRLLLHPTFIVVLLLIGWLGRFALRYWPDHAWSLGEANNRSIDRFTGLLGVASATLFGFITIAQWLPVFMVEPCW